MPVASARRATASPAGTRSARSSRTGRCCWSSCRPWRPAGASRRSPSSPCWCALIGLTRIALGVHFVSDVLGGWLLGAAWLGVTAYAFRLWRRERGRPVPPLTEGLEPEAGARHRPRPGRGARAAAPPGRRRRAAGRLGDHLRRAATASARSSATTPRAPSSTPWTPTCRAGSPTPAHRLPDRVSWWWSKFGDTHAILLVSLVFCPLVLAIWRRWRPVLFVVLAMFGELTLFLASARRGGPAPPGGGEPGRADAHLVVPVRAHRGHHLPLARRSRSSCSSAYRPLVALDLRGAGGDHAGRAWRSPGCTGGCTTRPTSWARSCSPRLWIGLLYWVIRPNADVVRGQPTRASSRRRSTTLDDELAKAGRPD